MGVLLLDSAEAIGGPLTISLALEHAMLGSTSAVYTCSHLLFTLDYRTLVSRMDKWWSEIRACTPRGSSRDWSIHIDCSSWLLPVIGMWISVWFFSVDCVQREILFATWRWSTLRRFDQSLTVIVIIGRLAETLCEVYMNFCDSLECSAERLIARSEFNTLRIRTSVRIDVL